MEGKDFCKENIGKEYLRKGERVKLVGWNEKNCGVIITYKNGWSRGNIGIYDHIDNSILKQSDLLYFVRPDELKEITESNKTIVMETRNVKVTLETAQRWYQQGGEFKEMALSAYTEDELNPVRNEWESKILGKMECGYFIYDSEIRKSNELPFRKEDKYLYNTEKQAKSALAYAQLTQLMALPEYNGNWVPDWENDSEKKFCIIPLKEELKIELFYVYRQKICFKNMELAEKFMENNFDLLKQFNELD